MSKPQSRCRLRADQRRPPQGLRRSRAAGGRRAGAAERLGWQVGEVVVENDTSAFKRRKVELPNGRHEFRVVRPGFRHLLDLIMSGAVDGLIAYDLDRTARDPRDLEDLIDAVEGAARLPVESVSGSLDSPTMPT